MKIDEGKILLLLSGILCGIVLMAISVKNPLAPIKFLTYSQYQDLNNETRNLKVELDGLYRESADLERKLQNYTDNDGENKVVIDTLKKELQQAQLFYGLTSVSGPGIKITVDDRHEYTDEFDLMNGITHDLDLLRIVGDLKNGGAEAVAVNGNRVINTTSIKCAGPITMINNEYVVPPFEITAIGDPEALEKSFTDSTEGYYNVLSFRGLYVNIIKLSTLTIPGYGETDTSKYAETLN
jgi:uncharacterized protein YlxW (UPF0749 family)